MLCHSTADMFRVVITYVVLSFLVNLNEVVVGR